MGGFVLVRGKRQIVRRQTVSIDAYTLQKIAKILQIEPSDQVTAISIAVSSRPQPLPAVGTVARSRPGGRAQRSTRSSSRRSSARSSRSARQT
jgi:hypothetical protein